MPCEEKIIPILCPKPLNPFQATNMDEKTYDSNGNINNASGPNGRIGSIPYCDERSGEMETYREWWDGITKQYGVRMDYYVSKFRIKGQQAMLFGENPSAGFYPPKRLIGMVEMNPENSILSRFGIQVTGEVKIVITFSEFKHFFGPKIYPKSGDLIMLTDAYCDRPMQFGPKIYEITSKTDEVINETNFMGRHYVWTLDAVRYQPSYESGAPEEAKIPPIASEDKNIGSSDKPIKKQYTETADQFAKENFDPQIKGSKDFIYGGY